MYVCSYIGRLDTILRFDLYLIICEMGRLCCNSLCIRVCVSLLLMCATVLEDFPLKTYDGKIIETS